SIRIATRALTANKLRSALTMLGIAIGVGAVISLVSIGHGVEKSVAEQFNSLGTNLLFVSPGPLGGSSGRGLKIKPLTYSDAQAIADRARVPDVEAVAPE